ncbi:class I SAM-dependent methyltransferase [Actinomadura sp. CNU-125]|uniref:class I SAM-dependent methyltransferase n=1 Tax=Actinomadura sp. CNU-125 TaxID=1904961 RepID=UPI0009F943D5|nr:methyltransferase domain-containing protein [Actinomadura sp. CNU-125]
MIEAGGRYTSTVALSCQANGPFTNLGWAAEEPEFLFTPDHLLILEILLHEHDLVEAEKAFAAHRNGPVPVEVERTFEEFKQKTKRLSLFSRGSSLLLIADEQMEPLADLTELSRSTRQVLRGFGSLRGCSTSSTTSDFRLLLHNLDERGYVAPVLGRIDWGQLRRLTPICPAFGKSRGTPIDRHYLDQFIAEVRSQVSGEVVEIGGRDGNRDAYGFTKAARYRGMDIAADPEVSLLCDATDPASLPPECLDAVVAFNVLEHTARPWEVVANMWRWLRPGGTAYCMVPNAQRVHEAPNDYWRPLPAALTAMFHDWSERRVRQYGNPLTVIASYMGVPAEELDAAELDAYHPEYPVASCIIAHK